MERLACKIGTSTETCRKTPNISPSHGASFASAFPISVTRRYGKIKLPEQKRSMIPGDYMNNGTTSEDFSLRHVWDLKRPRHVLGYIFPRG